ncbi:MAG: hypothetical protein KF835_00605 [Xanthobacteraceae bacterium]|nr:hypothetical protein [Xanthobacteraceae bacterium]
MNSPSQAQRLLRGFVLLCALAGTIYYIGIWRWWWLIDDRKRDGLELIGPILGTVYFILLVVPSWYFGLRSRALLFAAIPAALALILATDAAFHWFPWKIFGGN